MSKRKVGHGAWVVVCDGRKALILENLGDHMYPNLRMVETFEHADASTHVQGSDSPGRVHASVGTARSSVEQTDWHDAAEQKFLRDLASRLDAAIRAGQTGSLFVIAAPRALGVLRQAYTPAIRGALQHEMDKDLVREPIIEIEKRLFS